MPAETPTTQSQALAERVVRVLYERDRASQGLGIQILEVRPGYIRATMLVREDMVNGHNICHGGFMFTLADSAFAFCCNSYNVVTVAASATIDFLAPVHTGDRLYATAKERWRSRRAGLYEIEITNQNGALVALFRGRSHQLKDAILTD